MGPESGTRNDCGFSHKSQTHSIPLRQTILCWMIHPDKKHICSREGTIQLTVVTSMFQSFYREEIRPLATVVFLFFGPLKSLEQ